MMNRRIDSWVQWSIAHQRLYRTLAASVFIGMTVFHLFGSDGWYQIAMMIFNLSLLAMLMWLWWRMDVRDELSSRVAATMGDKHYGDVMWLVARQMRTRSVVKINTVLRDFDVMATPVDDLPPEARMVRETLESLEL